MLPVDPSFSSYLVPFATGDVVTVFSVVLLVLVVSVLLLLVCSLSVLISTLVQFVFHLRSLVSVVGVTRSRVLNRGDGDGQDSTQDPQPDNGEGRTQKLLNDSDRHGGDVSESSAG